MIIHVAATPESEDTDDLCKSNFDCTLNSRIQQTIRLRISDNGNSFAEITKKCFATPRMNADESDIARSSRCGDDYEDGSEE